MKEFLCTPQELKEKLDREEPFLLLDVRTPEEFALAHIGGSLLIPMNEIPSRVGEIEDFLDQEIVVLCHHGIRSANVQAWLRQQGFRSVRNLTGGIERYSLEADPTIPRY